jgi:hypothetical protein
MVPSFGNVRDRTEPKFEVYRKLSPGRKILKNVS